MKKLALALALIATQASAEVLIFNGNVTGTCSWSNNVAGTIMASGVNLYSTGSATASVTNNSPSTYTVMVDAPTLTAAPAAMSLVSVNWSMLIQGGPNSGETVTGDNTQRTVPLAVPGSDDIVLSIIAGELNDVAEAGTYQMQAIATCASL